MRTMLFMLAVEILGGAACFAVATAAEKPSTVGPDPKLYQTVVDRAIQFLAERQADDGSLSPQVGLGPTALAALGLLEAGRSPTDPQVAKSLKYLELFTQESGGIHAPGSRIPVYETCIAAACLKRANRDGRYDKILKDAEKFLRGNQWDENRDTSESNPNYGGLGYGGRTRPDLSNTAFVIDALKSLGAGSDDPAIQKALKFVSRCQNLESEHNTTQYAAMVNDGGFYYTCAVDKPQPERETPEGGLRSYGSMTYSGLKSMIHAGLTKDDPRVKAAVGWIRKNYDLKNNPGQGDAGLYYYYHTFAKALDAMGVDEIEDAQGVKHDWRRELVEELARRQKENGSWVNANPQWMEGDPNLATAFALLALTYCRPVSMRSSDADTSALPRNGIATMQDTIKH